MPELSGIDLAMFLPELPARPFHIGPRVLLLPPEGARRLGDRRSSSVVGARDRRKADSRGPRPSLQCGLGSQRLACARWGANRKANPPMIEKKLPASVDKVLARLTDPRWLEARSLAQGEVSAKCAAQKKSTAIVVTMKRRLRRELNAVVSKVLSPESDIEIEERWVPEGKGYKGSYALKIPGKPITVSGDFELLSEGKGCVYRIQHRAKVSLPLIGGVVEKFVLGQTETASIAELDYLAADLKSNP